jgi:hypothetical protein
MVAYGMAEWDIGLVAVILAANGCCYVLDIWSKDGTRKAWGGFRPAATAKPALHARPELKGIYLHQKEHPHPGPSRSNATAQEYGGTKWNLRGFSRTGRPVTKSHAPAPSRLKIRGVAAH